MCSSRPSGLLPYKCFSFRFSSTWMSEFSRQDSFFCVCVFVYWGAACHQIQVRSSLIVFKGDIRFLYPRPTTNCFFFSFSVVLFVCFVFFNSHISPFFNFSPPFLGLKSLFFTSLVVSVAWPLLSFISFPLKILPYGLSFLLPSRLCSSYLTEPLEKLIKVNTSKMGRNKLLQWPQSEYEVIQKCH